MKNYNHRLRIEIIHNPRILLKISIFQELIMQLVYDI